MKTIPKIAMDEKLHRQLIDDTEALRRIVAKSSTEHIVGNCYAFMLRRGSEDESFPLMSPVRQVFFLLGLMLTTDEPEEPEPFDENVWKRSVSLLNSVFGYYAGMYWPSEGDEVTEEWRRVREVAMPAFLHYFNVAILASVEQMSRRFQKYVVPFDDVLSRLWGISGSEVLRILDWVGNHLQGTIDDLMTASDEERAARHDLLDQAKREGWNLDRIREEAQKESYMPLMERVVEGFFSIAKVEHSALEAEFGSELSDCFWDLMVSRRGEGHSLQYITEDNHAQSHPLFEVDDRIAMCPSFNALYYALLEVGERTVLSSESRESFLKHRDRILEAEAREEFESILGEDGEYWTEVYETPDLHYEHDLVIRWERTLLVVEAKASPPVEPFRDPDKAFTRIERAFRSDRGIQKGFEQADRIRQRLAMAEIVDLYGNDRQHVVSLVPEDIDAVYSICVTRDDFGALAVDLSLLLQKDDEAPYPWAVNILDLSTLADTYEYLGWGGERLVAYLEKRQELHGKLFATDELEVAGFSIEHGSLQFLLEQEADKCHIPADYSDVFDRVYEARRGGEPVTYSPTEPYATDIREILREMMSEGPDEVEPTVSRTGTYRQAPKQGRNERCACGSGKKYKHCCGRPPRNR